MLSQFRVFLLFVLLLPCLGHAVEFNVYQSDYKPLNVALMIDADEEIHTQKSLVYGVVQRDLASSQSFRMLNPMGFLLSSNEAWASVSYDDWRIIGADVLVLCQIHETNGLWHVQMQVHQPFQRKQLVVRSFESDTKGLRALAHQMANEIYHAILHVPGYFLSHVMYVMKLGSQSDLMYMDQDGYNLQPVGRHFTLLLSPDWSPNGQLVALNTYVGNRPRLEQFNLKTGERSVFGQFKGLNSTPEYSPDGKSIAATLSWTGNSDIHIYHIETGKWTQFTHYRGIDTTPTWSPDGKWIAFASNRSGSPQIYKKAVAGGKAERISIKANYNTSPVWSPKGDRIAFITKKNWQYALATARMDGSGLRYLATGQAIESPSWSPNGQMLLYSAEDHGVRRIYRVPSWGGRPEVITSSRQDASDPAWSRQ